MVASVRLRLIQSYKKIPGDNNRLLFNWVRQNMSLCKTVEILEDPNRYRGALLEPMLGEETGIEELNALEKDEAQILRSGGGGAASI